MYIFWTLKYHQVNLLNGAVLFPSAQVLGCTGLFNIVVRLADKGRGGGGGGGGGERRNVNIKS